MADAQTQPYLPRRTSRQEREAMAGYVILVATCTMVPSVMESDARSNSIQAIWMGLVRGARQIPYVWTCFRSFNAP